MDGSISKVVQASIISESDAPSRFAGTSISPCEQLLWGPLIAIIDTLRANRHGFLISISLEC
jgi:hypothetical protein